MFKSWMPAFAGMTSDIRTGITRSIRAVMTIALFSLIPICCYATSWPTFSPPSLKFLMDNNLLNTANCPAGEVRINPDLKLNIQQHFCRRNCPSSWEWTLVDDQSCHPLSDFNFLRYTFKYVKHGQDEYETLYTEITADYGKLGSSQPALQFTFTSEKDNHWGCSEMNPELHTIICANDM